MGWEGKKWRAPWEEFSSRLRQTQANTTACRGDEVSTHTQLRQPALLIALKPTLAGSRAPGGLWLRKGGRAFWCWQSIKAREALDPLLALGPGDSAPSSVIDSRGFCHVNGKLFVWRGSCLGFLSVTAYSPSAPYSSHWGMEVVSSLQNGTNLASENRKDLFPQKAHQPAINFTFHWNTWWRKNLILLLPCLKPSKSLPMARGCTSQRWLHTRNTWEISEMPVSWLQPRPIMPESMGGGIQALHWCFVFWKLLSDSQRRSRRSTDALTDLCQAP